MPRARVKKALQRIERDSFLATCADEIVEFHAEALHHFARRCVKPDLVEDLVNDVWLSVLQQLEKVSAMPQEGQRAWLFTVMTNRTRDWMRKRQRRRETSLDFDGAIDEPSASDSEPVDIVHVYLMRAAMRAALDRLGKELGETNASIVRAHYFEGRLYGELALEVGLDRQAGATANDAGVREAPQSPGRVSRPAVAPFATPASNSPPQEEEGTGLLLPHRLPLRP